MLLQAWRLRSDPAWRSRFLPAILLSALCFAALRVDVLMHVQPRGLAQKCLIALIVTWLLLAAWWLRCGARTAMLQAPDSRQAPTPR